MKRFRLALEIEVDNQENVWILQQESLPIAQMPKAKARKTRSDKGQPRKELIHVQPVEPTVPNTYTDYTVFRGFPTDPV